MSISKKSKKRNRRLNKRIDSGKQVVTEKQHRVVDVGNDLGAIHPINKENAEELGSTYDTYSLDPSDYPDSRII